MWLGLFKAIILKCYAKYFITKYYALRNLNDGKVIIRPYVSK